MTKHPPILNRAYDRFPIVKRALMAGYLRTPSFITHPTYDLVRKFVRPDPRERDFDRVFRLVRRHGIHGAYAEFGVMQGASIILAARAARRCDLRMRFFGFDSFEGLPSDEGDVFHKGEYRSDIETTRRYLSRAGVEAELVSGLFAESLTPAVSERIGQIAVGHLDADIYESTRDVLSFIEPLLATGAYLIFDDWNAFGGDPAHGERRAFLEWGGHQRCTELEVRDGDQCAIFRYD